MKNILSAILPQRHQAQMIISMMGIILIFISFQPEKAHGQIITQSNTVSTDSVKNFLFLCWLKESTFQCPVENFDKDLTLINKYYSEFDYSTTGELTLPVSHWLDSIFPSDPTILHSIQLFKIKTNSNYPPYYVLKINPSQNVEFAYYTELWLRISGFYENDIKIFFDNLLTQGMSYIDIQRMIEVWCDSNPMFQEIQWDCLFDGYKNNNTQKDCYLSNEMLFYSARNTIHGYFDTHAIFSRIPLSGRIK